MLAFRNLTILNRRDPRAGRLDKITEFLRQSVYCPLETLGRGWHTGDCLTWREWLEIISTSLMTYEGSEM